MTEEGGKPKPDRVAQLFGAMLMAVGVLVMLCSGLCSLAVLAMQRGGQTFSMILAVVIFGGVPATIGFGVFMLGRLLFWPDRRPSDPANGQ